MAVKKYDPNTKKWTKLASMHEPRHVHAVAVLDGKLYACGGDDKKSVEVYDPARNSWRLVASMKKERGDFCAIAREGKLLAIGGDMGMEMEVYDPSRNEWQIDQEMSAGLQIGFPTCGVILSSDYYDIK